MRAASLALFALRRLLHAIPLLLCVVVLNYALIACTPGDPGCVTPIGYQTYNRVFSPGLVNYVNAFNASDTTTQIGSAFARSNAPRSKPISRSGDLCWSIRTTVSSRIRSSANGTTSCALWPRHKKKGNADSRRTSMSSMLRSVIDWSP